MRYVCLGYVEENKWETLSERDRNIFINESFAYDDELRLNGHFLGGEALQGPRTAATLRYQNGQIIVTDGPYVETKEFLGGILLLEAHDLNHAIQLMSRHPGVRIGGPFEIRPAASLEELLPAGLMKRADSAARTSNSQKDFRLEKRTT